MKNYLLISTLSTALFASAPALTAGSERQSAHALGSSLNSYGLGAFYTYKFDDRLHLRAALHGLAAEDVDAEFSGVDYEGDSDSAALGLMLDWYPLSVGWKRKLFISAGVMAVEAEYDASAEAKLGEEFFVGGVAVNSNNLAGLDLNIEHERQVVPYIGLGWGNKTAGDSGFAWVTQIGLIHLDDPTVTLTANDPDGVLSEANLHAEREAIIDDEGGVSGFLSIGLSYHF